MDSYHVLQLVGEGSFGRVFKGRRRFTGQVVALKFIPKRGRSENEVRNLQKEIEIMRGLQHPNIIQLYDSFQTEAEVVVVTEYAEGQLLQILEDDGNLPESQVRDIACQLVSALYYLHAHRIVHRDMKPQNILLGKTGVVKLCDFGFARAMSVSTLVLTSIKGTPLYMSPELVEEKPYDHTTDLWSLGCILYELHTGVPPFYTNSIFHLVRLIVKETVRWPDTMSDTCKSFLKGLLIKDPQIRLSWPDLLHHPFVADGVRVESDKNVPSPLVVTPSPDMLALKLQQVTEKTVPKSGESRLLRKARAQRDNSKGEKLLQSDAVKMKKDETGSKRTNSAMAAASPRAKPHPSENVSLKNQSQSKSKHRSQISKDYEQEFLVHGQVGPQMLPTCGEDSHTTLHQKDVDIEEFPKSPSSQQSKRLNYSTIIPELTSNILAFRTQLTDDETKEAWWMHQPLKVLLNLVLTSDVERSHRIGQELGLPHILFELIHITVKSSNFIKQPWGVPILRDMIVVLRIYLRNHSDWMKEEQRLEEFTKPFITILIQPSLISLAPLAASVLSQMTQHNVEVQIDVDNLTASLKNLLLDLDEPQASLIPGWGLCDGLLSLLLHNLHEHANGSGVSHLDPVMFLALWKRIGASLAKTRPDTGFCSANGLHSLLSIMQFVLTQDPYSYIPLFSEPTSKCAATLCWVLGTDCFHLFAAGSPERAEVDVSHDSVRLLTCQLLCFPISLDLPSYTMSTILQLYDSCGVFASLLQVIQTLPTPLLEVPLSLLSHLLLFDPERSFPRLRKAPPGFFTPPRNSQLPSTEHQTPQSRNASSLLSELLQQHVLWDSGETFLIVLSQVVRCYSQHSHLQLHLEASVLHQALSHPCDQIRAATCRLLGNLNPFMPPTQHTLQPDIFQNLIDYLYDSSMLVRRMACRGVGNWLGYLAAGTGSKMRKPNGKACDTAWREQENDTAGALAAIVEPGVADEEACGWLEKARRTVPKLASLITDPDALTRRHCCAALASLVNVDGAASLLLEEGVFGLLLRAACTDFHYAVRQAAIATLCLYSGEDAVQQVLISLNASKRLLKASQHAPPLCDYHQLIGLLPVSPVHEE